MLHNSTFVYLSYIETQIAVLKLLNQFMYAVDFLTNVNASRATDLKMKQKLVQKEKHSKSRSKR